MAKKFIKKRRLKLKYRLFLYLLIFSAFIKVLYSLSLNIKLSDSNTDLINYLLIDSNSHLSYDNNINTVVSKITSAVSYINTSSPKDMLSSYFGELNENDENIFAYTNAKYVDNNINKPKVYIYDTHQNEMYQSDNLTNIKPNVLSVAELLASNLEKLGIEVVVEKADFIEYMSKNNLDHNSSYKVSRVFLLDAMKNNDFDLIIDLHRDAIPRSVSTTVIDNMEYAKVLFVIGTLNPNYVANEEVSRNISDILARNYPTITRGIYKRDSVYNQDLASNIILLEMGADVNYISEVVNTTPLVAQAIAEYLGE